MPANCIVEFSSQFYTSAVQLLLLTLQLYLYTWENQLFSAAFSA